MPTSVKATMTATEVIARLSPEPCPYDLEGALGQKLGWRRTDFKNTIPALEYLAAMENGDGPAIERLRTVIATSRRLEAEQHRLEKFLTKEGKTAATLLAEAQPHLDEIHRAKKAWELTREQVHEMAESGQFEMTGIPAAAHTRSGEPMEGARPEVVDSALFRGAHHLIDDYSHVVTRNGHPRYSDVRFLTAQIEAWIEQRQEQRAEAAEQEAGQAPPKVATDQDKPSLRPATELEIDACIIALDEARAPGSPKLNRDDIRKRALPWLKARGLTAKKGTVEARFQTEVHRHRRNTQGSRSKPRS
jgi:hypothetical protein